MTAANWGDVPTWLAAIGTVGTLIVTAVLLRREQQDRRSTQAAGVAANIASAAADGTLWTADVTNASAAPIYRCLVDLVGRNGTIRGSGVLDTLPPGATGNLRPTVDPPTRGDERLRARLTFLDSAGRLWQRDEEGQLRELRRRAHAV